MSLHLGRPFDKTDGTGMTVGATNSQKFGPVNKIELILAKHVTGFTRTMLFSIWTQSNASE